MSSQRHAVKAQHQFIHQSGKPYQCKVRRTNQHMYALIVDRNGKLLKEMSTFSKSVKSGQEKTDKKGLAYQLGKALGQSLQKDLKIAKDAIMFNRNGLLYHGRVSKVAEGLRESGINI
jgi:large subunit ribosomal protein L18